CQSVPAYKYK
ncbi:hypothetical protein KIPB_010950, partial [Kipferlia bialata]